MCKQELLYYFYYIITILYELRLRKKLNQNYYANQIITTMVHLLPELGSDENCILHCFNIFIEYYLYLKKKLCFYKFNLILTFYF